MNDRSADLQCELDDTRERLAEVLETMLRLDAMVEAANDATYTLSHRLEIETWNPGDRKSVV